ncbi:DUF2905 family protein [Cloacibacillus porcorum]
MPGDNRMSAKHRGFHAPLLIAILFSICLFLIFCLLTHEVRYG